MFVRLNGSLFPIIRRQPEATQVVVPRVLTPNREGCTSCMNRNVIELNITKKIVISFLVMRHGWNAMGNH